jgi:tRNA pseudouridine55 synthase
MDGILIIDKPTGITSHDVVDEVRRRLRTRRVGHTGTLDPMATGVLVVLVGKATKSASRYLDEQKEYLAGIRLGISTDTGDRDGKIIQQQEVAPFPVDKICSVLRQFEGEIWQNPPPYSAIHYKGRRLYEWAREGKRFEGPPRRIKIDKIELVEYLHPTIRIHMVCSKGTYVRRLAEQMGEVLGVPAHLENLRRLRVGILRIEQSISLDAVSQDRIVASVH